MRIALDAATTSLVEELKNVLDEEITLLNVRRSQLESLSGAIVDRDDNSLQRLLGDIEEAMSMQTATDMRLKAMRNTLAGSLGMDTRNITLSQIMDNLPAVDRAEIEYRRQQIALLADALRRQHMETAMLLRECSRINKMMLDMLLGRKESVTTYNPRGMNGWSSQSGVVDMER